MAIPRPHLFEVIDQPWYPNELRDLQTEGLSRFMGPSFSAVAPVIREVLRETQTAKIVDLCSGGGGPWGTLHPVVSESGTVTLTLTDAYPNLGRYRRLRNASGGRIQFSVDPVDARAVPAELDGMRTMFSAFHHLRPNEALAVLKNARDAGVGIAVFDVGSGRTNLGSLIQTLVFFGLFAPLMNLVFYWFLTPTLGPLSWQRVVFTYLIPIVPFVTAWDGLVSGLRSYTQDELTQMATELAADDYTWRVGEVKTKRFPIHYIVGYPQRHRAAPSSA